MADYHAILRRAISAMPTPNGEARRAVYEKARTALVGQLKSFDPPLTPSEITQQRLQLEDAIRRVESEAAKGLLRTPPSAPPVQPPPSPVAAAPAPVEARAEPAAAPPVAPIPAPAAVAAKPMPPEAPRPAVQAPVAVNTMKKVVDEAEALGAATAELGRQARDALDEAAVPDPGPGVFAREAEAVARKSETQARRKRREQARDGEKPKTRLPVLIGVAVAILVFVIGIVSLWSQREAISALLGGTPEPVVDISKRPVGEKLAPKVADRLGSDDATKPAGGAKPVPTQTITTTPQLQSSATEAPKTETPVPQQAVALVAQKAILYEEGKAGGQAMISTGRVVWQTAPDPTDPKPGAIQLKARIEIPDRKMVVSMQMHPNSDTAFPASHMIELRFELGSDFDGKAVAGVPGIILKANEQARGDPLNGASAKVADNFFWVALGAAEQEKARNMRLLKERGWIDIPLLYETGRRAILTIEKSGAGDQVVSDALAAWGNGG